MRFDHDSADIVAKGIGVVVTRTTDGDMCLGRTLCQIDLTFKLSECYASIKVRGFLHVIDVGAQTARTAYTSAVPAASRPNPELLRTVKQGSLDFLIQGCDISSTKYF